MTDIKLTFDNTFKEYDINILNCDLQYENKIETAVIISLFSWSKSGNSELDSKLNYGWFGDRIDEENTNQIGSRLYLLKREKITDETISLIKEYIKQALNWMINDEIISDISINVDRNLRQDNRIDASIILSQQNNPTIIKLNNLWG